MTVQLTRIAKFILCAAALAGTVSLLEPGRAAQTQTQAPHLFTPQCAAPRANCAENVCARRGRCAMGKSLAHSGCLYYFFCKRKAH
jgi:hypothetical protein